MGSQPVDKKLFSPRRGRIALSANERIAEFLDFAILAKFAYVNKLRALSNGLFLLPGIVRAFLFYLLLLFAALYIADLYLNAVRLWIPASAHAALSGLSSM